MAVRETAALNCDQCGIFHDGLSDFALVGYASSSMVLTSQDAYRTSMKKGRTKTRRQAHGEAKTIAELQVIPAPTIVWHPSVSLEKLISDFSEYRDAIIVG